MKQQARATNPTHARRKSSPRTSPWRSFLRAAAGAFALAFLAADLGASPQVARFCVGDSGCPCGNDSAPGLGQGCRNSTGSGALIQATGNAWVLEDTLTLRVSLARPNQNGIFVQNISANTGSPFFDGRLCLPIDAHLVRHYDPPAIMPTTTNGAGTGFNAQPMTTGDFLGDTQPGVSVYYQFWYRDYPGYGTACTQGANFSSGVRVTWALVGSGMVEIPGGSFEMGHHVGGLFGADELPLHPVTLDTFFMDTHEVTNQEYCAYLNSAYGQGLIELQYDAVKQAVPGPQVWYYSLNATSHYNRIEFDGTTFIIEPGFEEHPVSVITWKGTTAYANWLSAEHGLTPCYDLTSWTCDTTANGYRLPTEAEWEYAARGGEHSPYYMYPWGDTLTPSSANYYNSGDPYEGNPILTTPAGYYDGNQTPAGVDMANGYGLYDMAGNVFELCNDWYDPTYYATSPVLNPLGPATGTEQVVRGGSFAGITTPLRSADRAWLPEGMRKTYVGFRLVRR